MRRRWMRRLAAGLPALMSLLACAPLTHTVEPYRSDPSQGAALQRRAAARCEQSSQARRETPEKPFVTDGCSAWFSGEWVGCCVEHDIDYWCGGDAKARHRADRKLRRPNGSRLERLARLLGGAGRRASHLSDALPLGLRSIALLALVQ